MSAKMKVIQHIFLTCPLIFEDILIKLSMITGKEMNKCARDMHFYTYKPSGDILWDVRQTV